MVTSHPHFPFHLLKLNFTSRAPEKAKRKVKVESGGERQGKARKTRQQIKKKLSQFALTSQDVRLNFRKSGRDLLWLVNPGP